MTSGLLWRGGLGDLSLSGTIIRREALQQVPQAISILDEAESIRNSLSQSEEAAKQKGYEQGLERGRADAVSQALHTIADADRICQRLSDELVEIVSRGFDALLDASTRQAISDNAIKQALSQSESAQTAEILVAQVYLDQATELAMACVGSPLPSWLTVRADPGLSEADVVFIADGKVLDCRLKTRLTQWRESLQREVHRELTSVVAGPEDEVVARND